MNYKRELSNCRQAENMAAYLKAEGYKSVNGHFINKFMYVWPTSKKYGFFKNGDEFARSGLQNGGLKVLCNL